MHFGLITQESHGFSRVECQESLKENKNHFGKTAAQLGISRTTLWRRIKAWEEEKRNKPCETLKRYCLLGTIRAMCGGLE